MQGKRDTINVVMVENVSTVYEGERKPAIKDVNLNIDFNELVFLVGPNASGKTTLLETINGLQPMSKGRILVFGLDIRYYGKTIRQEIGYVPQDFMVGPLEPYTAMDVAMMGRYSKIGILRKPKKEDFEKTIEAMRLVGVDDLAKRPIGKLSGGQQQKVMISRALAKEPKLLLLDEPFSNLDPYSRRGILELMGHLHDEHKMTIIVVTHDLQQIPKQCQRVVVMNGGRIVADGTPEEALTTFENYQSLNSLEAFT